MRSSAATDPAFSVAPIHHDSVELDALGIQMRAETRVEHGIVFQHHNRGFHRVGGIPPALRIFHPASSAR